MRANMNQGFTWELDKDMVRLYYEENNSVAVLSQISECLSHESVQTIVMQRTEVA